ncbi:uncharacterized protein LOC143283918 [Babylonia areolata]|uniref:uncharacterized protein LOC143283918 n=1 Tax=Babylonia areolata TaxID=304850 RepID=UPI003FD374BD
MVAVLRVVALALLALAITLHVVGFATNQWITANVGPDDMKKVLKASGMEDPTAASFKQLQQLKLDVQMGLWKYCMRSNIDQWIEGLSGSAMGTGGQGNQWPNGDPSGDQVDTTPPPSSGYQVKEQCVTISATPTVIPDWMKAVRALGILSLITAVLGIGFIIYSFIGDSKGDRARLLPHIMAGICLLAGVLLLIAVAVYGGEFMVMMQEQMNSLQALGEMGKYLAEVTDNSTTLGYSFALEAVSGVLMVVTSVLLILPAVRSGGSGGPHNLAV